ncbi:MnmC family methyltransferase [Bdellovibrio reynosensis]|uniref:MnmC family methyltransferase n=1 Tax=Bdellovibrio reynosensis TaxID=2835041 RepID=A0ABY4CAR4_9BACT|nr:MnmC family methyltransferase [Bdellovibrio reynosensis]UOF02022.1 MnmC family methyltransferase [Bdellovibrio reynosensis]
MKSWADIGFEIEITRDESPSLRLLHSIDPNKPYGESMHHSGGAATETFLIYGAPIKETLEKIQNPHFLVVGLGIGYIELVIAKEALLLGRSSQDVGLITSYESLPELREYFHKWLQGRTTELHPEVVKTYEAVVAAVLADSNLKAQDLKNFVLNHFKSVDDIQTALLPDSKPLSKYHCILYDAFSSKTTPHLWEEEFLTEFFKEGTAENALVSSYACRVSFKNALTRAGFNLVIRPGFMSKRNSTLGTKNF